MAPKLFMLALLISLISSVTSHDITKMLAQFPEFSSYNDLLSQTQMAAEINSHQMITVFAAGASATSAISNQPAYVLRRILALHVIRDYYDNNKLSHIANTSIEVSTLFETTGHSTGKNGYLTLADIGGNMITVRSAEPGARNDAHIVKLVVSQPHNISVVEISGFIIPPNIGSDHSMAPAPAPAPAETAAAPSIGAPAPHENASSGNRGLVVNWRLAGLVGFGVAIRLFFV
ncbi:uncharacterized protein A4U43_C05F34840 [Asparagus officinalis]|uniref:FAS1 domain-containing protein n=1 Tax=Asparagus officinalis TaxID=4686 RepID=A0A5P1EZH3_ASPOF|nr:fasciclin-like arabinogalactan protein 14 [Asparagus officinalis]ONK70547.1 uncharacterized protein A4U43_C05F34840 [Asparagus officinalis]